MTDSKAVFLSYAQQDAQAAHGICEALRNAGIEVWFDQSELRGGDAWDTSIRKQIKSCALFVPIISHNTHDRDEGYFRLEWKLAVDRSHLMSADKAFLLPVVIDDTPDNDERVPERFREVQWTRLPGGATAAAFVERARRLLSGESASGPTEPNSASDRGNAAPSAQKAALPWWWSKATILSAIAVVVVALGYLAVDRFVLSKRNAEAGAAPAAQRSGATAFNAPPHSIAVLPFVNLSGDKDQEYFSDGLTEELIDMLTKVPDLRVPARTSSFYFKGKQATIGEIAKALGVANVLEGSVRKNGRTIRITAQLIRADSGYHVWSKTYDRLLDDIFKIQDEIAGAVVSALQLSLSANAVKSASRSSSADSYAVLMQAQYFLFRQTLEDQQKAFEYYKRAIDADQTSAAAWGGLSRATANLWSLGVLSWKDAHNDALRAAERAVALDPQLADAHIALGKVYLNLGQDYASAKRELDAARGLDPESSITLFWSAAAALVSGDIEKAIQLSQQAAAKDPLDGETNMMLGQSYYYAGRLEEAKYAYGKALDLIPARPGLHAALGVVLLAKGEREEALQEIAREQVTVERDTALAGVYHILGRNNEAQSALTRLEAAQADSDAYAIARNYALRSDRDQTFRWLDRAYQQHEYLMEVKVDPWFDSARGDPRYNALLNKLKLPE